MGFADRYVHALNATSLKDDAESHQAEPLLASALSAAEVGSDLGPLLHRVKYASTIERQSFAANPANLAQLLRLWIAEVTKRGRARKWMSENTHWDASAAHKLYRTVAEASLAHWLDSTCKCCNGTGVVLRRHCQSCAGSGTAQIDVAGCGGFVLERTKDMVGELHNIVITHASRASAKLRQPR